MIDDKVKYEILTKLHQGFSTSTIAEEYNIPISTILRYKREFKQAIEDGNIDSLIDIDRVVLGEIVDKVKSDALPKEINEAANRVSNGLQGLQTLQLELQTTASMLNQRIRTLVPSSESIGELQMLTDCLCTLQNSFFNKNLTQVNVQNNYGNEDEKYSSFLSDQPAH